MFIKIIYWILFFVWWVLTLKYRKMIYDWTGKFMWAEKYLWSGWTVIVIILVWLLLIFLSIAYPAWVFESLNSNSQLQRINTLE